MHILSLWAGKATLILLKLFNRRGAALPGLVVEKLDKSFLQYYLNKLPEGTVLISGTNGKTTTTKILTNVLRHNGKKVLTNPTGSNFTRGITSSLVQQATWSGDLKYDIAVLELDEAYAAIFVQTVKPRVSVILNVMRDQMDRFGEIDKTAKLLTEVVKNTTSKIVLNRDDNRVKRMAEITSCPVIFYGVGKDLRDIFRSDDELHGDLDTSFDKADCMLLQIGDEEITTSINGKKYVIKLSLYGIYNAQNVCAVISACLALGLSPEHFIKPISKVKPAFGRGERIIVGNKKVILQLVKNPGGFRHSLLGAVRINEDIDIIAINDNYADGRDVSWLWDVDFSSLANKKIITTGTRASDMSLRLSYDDIKTDIVEQNLSKAIDFALNKTHDGGTVHIYTTYTAMLKIRNILAKKTQVEKV